MRYIKQVFIAFCYLFVCFIISNQLAAQQKFIEVNVADTVLVRADLFVYKIALLQNDEVEYSELRNKDGIGYSKAMVQEEKKLKRIYDSVLHVLKNDKFSFIAPTVADTFNITQRDYNVYSASILLHSFDSLSLLYDRIKKVKYLVGSVDLAKASDETTYQKLLYEKLLNEAMMKAKSIAAYTNQKITGIQSVVENAKENESIGGWTAYPPLSNLAQSVISGWHATIKSSPDLLVADVAVIDQYPLANSLTVRFLVE